MDAPLLETVRKILEPVLGPQGVAIVTLVGFLLWPMMKRERQTPNDPMADLRNQLAALNSRHEAANARVQRLEDEAKDAKREALQLRRDIDRLERWTERQPQVQHWTDRTTPPGYGR